MFTFSQMVDRVVARSGRPDRLVDSTDFLNQTVRDAHTNRENQPVFFSKNMVEDQLTATSETSYTWTPPVAMQRFLAMRYSSIITAGFPTGVYPKHLKPGRAMNNEDYFFYFSGGTCIMKGYGGTDALIDIAYYEYPARLAYYAAAARPATYDETTATWTYLTAVTDDEKTAARALVQNWILRDWYDVCLEGTLAKLFKLVDDKTRAATHYSLYQQQRTQLWGTESVDAVGM